MTSVVPQTAREPGHAPIRRNHPRQVSTAENRGSAGDRPQALKRVPILATDDGTTEVVPFPKRPARENV